MSSRPSTCGTCGLRWKPGHECPTSGPAFDAGLAAARDGVLRTETCWPQARKDGYAAGWLCGHAEQEPAS